MTHPPSALPHEQRLRDAKARLLSHSRELSPLKFVQKHPFVSVGATAATTMLLTAVAMSDSARKATGSAVGAVGKPTTKGLIDLATKIATLYMTTHAAAATHPKPQTENGHAVD